jgi:hypothetical protein
LLGGAKDERENQRGDKINCEEEEKTQKLSTLPNAKKNKIKI